MKPLYGYCAVTADFLHIGHIEFLAAASEECQKLLVGIMTDECVAEYKGFTPIMNTEDRREVVRNLKCVWKTFRQDSFEWPHFVFRLQQHYEEDFIIIDSDEHKEKRFANVTIPGGIKRQHQISSSLLRRLASENIGHSVRPL